MLRASFAITLIALSSPVLAKEIVALPHWTYDEQAKWGKLSPEFSACNTGVKQSPIDIKSLQKSALLPLKPSYQKISVKLFNNGHTVQVNIPEGNRLVIGDKEYSLVQFHFHAPSEHHIDGKFYPMELHLVHKDKEGKLAVIAVMLQEGQGSPVIQRVLDYLPEQTGEENSRDVKMNIADLLPKSPHYYSYEGSLTTPPCSENVRWIVMMEPMMVSKEQIHAFQKVIGKNARAVQPLNGRVIKTD